MNNLFTAPAAIPKATSLGALLIGASLLCVGCERPTPLQLAAGASLSNQLIEGHLAAIQRQDFCRREEVSEILERTTTQEFDEMGRIERQTFTASAGSNSEVVIRYRDLDDGSLETEVVARVFLDSGERISRQLTQVDAEGRETFYSRDQTDDGSLDVIIETTYGPLTETRVVMNGPNTTTTTTTRDEFGNIVSSVSEGSGTERTTQTTYTEDGTRPLRELATTRGLGALEDLETTWTYNDAGYEASMVITLGGAPRRQREWEFDDEGTPISVLDREFLRGETRIHRDATLVYSGENLVSEVGVRFIDGSDYVATLTASRRFQYDAANRLVRETIETPEGTWEAAWTWNGERLERYRAGQGASFDERRFRYDAMGRLTAVERDTTDGYALDTTWTYDCL
ncbi:MAG: hypothetical protein AB8H86_31545 [Polyangiales bacterium]